MRYSYKHFWKRFLEIPSFSRSPALTCSWVTNTQFLLTFSIKYSLHSEFVTFHMSIYYFKLIFKRARLNIETYGFNILNHARNSYTMNLKSQTFLSLCLGIYFVIQQLIFKYTEIYRFIVCNTKMWKHGLPSSQHVM